MFLELKASSTPLLLLREPEEPKRPKPDACLSLTRWSSFFKVNAYLALGARMGGGWRDGTESEGFSDAAALA